MIHLRNLEKSFPARASRTYLGRQINLDIAEGDFVTIMGPSGAGKSTLLSVIGFYDHAWEGESQFHGQPVHQLKVKERAALNKKHVGFVFQQFHLLEDLTVAENLDIPLSYRDIKKSQREAIVGDTLDRFGMVEKKDLFPNQLSGGQQQLVAVARALIAKPALLLADEPTGNLHSDPWSANHGAVQKTQHRTHHHHPGDSFRDERDLWQPHHSFALWLDGEMKRPWPAVGGPSSVVSD